MLKELSLKYLSNQKKNIDSKKFKNNLKLYFQMF